MISNKDDLYYLSDWRLRDNKVGALSNIYHFNDIFISAYLRQKNGQFRQQRGLVCSKSLYWLQTAWNIWEQSSIFRDDPVTTKVWLNPVPAGPPGDGYEAEWVTPEVRDSHKDTVIGGLGSGVNQSDQDGGVQHGRGERQSVWRTLPVPGRVSHPHLHVSQVTITITTTVGHKGVEGRVNFYYHFLSSIWGPIWRGEDGGVTTFISGEILHLARRESPLVYLTQMRLKDLVVKLCLVTSSYWFRIQRKETWSQILASLSNLINHHQTTREGMISL